MQQPQQFPGTEDDMVPITQQNLNSVVTLVRSIFPVAYTDSFYRDILETDNAKVIMYNNEAIAIVAVNAQYDDYFGNVLYVKSLGVHPAFRKQGIGKRLVQYTYRKCFEAQRTRVMLHVQVSNQTAVDFYEHLGFFSDKMILNYYSRCESADALVMIKNL